MHYKAHSKIQWLKTKKTYVTHVSVGSNSQDLLRSRLTQVHCFFHFILLSKASHIVKPKVKEEIHSASLVGRIVRSTAKGMDTGMGRELEPMMHSSPVITGITNLNWILLLEDSGVSVSVWGLGVREREAAKLMSGLSCKGTMSKPVI